MTRTTAIVIVLALCAGLLLFALPQLLNEQRIRQRAPSLVQAVARQPAKNIQVELSEITTSVAIPNKAYVYFETAEPLAAERGKNELTGDWDWYSVRFLDRHWPGVGKHVVLLNSLPSVQSGVKPAATEAYLASDHSRKRHVLIFSQFLVIVDELNRLNAEGAEKKTEH